MCISDRIYCFFFLMIRRPPRSTQSRSSAASDVYKRQVLVLQDSHNILWIYRENEYSTIMEIESTMYVYREKETLFFVYKVTIYQSTTMNRQRVIHIRGCLIGIQCPIGECDVCVCLRVCNNCV
eukprot:TRINITY_DN3782_c0_g1_i10.p2 TRINITY_DN3782_c0_g1~~TRINITY_DN3782_c0_g1_i10.p2  ORF type:complete len:124 (+),score=8.83 TRINITY_DN3782_c0_g1_i10:3-374(+)